MTRVEQIVNRDFDITTYSTTVDNSCQSLGLLRPELGGGGVNLCVRTGNFCCAVEQWKFPVHLFANHSQSQIVAVTRAKWSRKSLQSSPSENYCTSLV